MNKLSDKFNFIIRCFQNLNNKIVSNPLDLGNTKINFELFILLLNESINIYTYFINRKLCKKSILSEIISNNINLIDSQTLSVKNFLEQSKEIQFKHYLIKINIILEKVTQNYLENININYLSIDGFLKLLKDYNIIPKLITQFKAISLFFTFSIISNLANFNINNNSFDNPIFYLFLKKLRKFLVNRISLIEIFYIIIFEYNKYKILDGEFFYSMICDIFFYDKKSGISLISGINNKYFKVYNKQIKFK